MSRTLPTESEMMHALVERDRSYEGIFFACVRTTGIFCRPTCPARKPRPENVEFVATADEAVRLGYRACKMCRPLDPPATDPDWVRELLTAVEQRPERPIRDADLVSRGLEPARVRRHFRRHYGMTFHAYQRAWRLGQAVSRLDVGATIGATVGTAGYESESGFRDAFSRLFGEPPGRGRHASRLTVKRLSSPLGPMIAIASSRGVQLLEWIDRRGLEREITDLRRRGGPIVPGTNEHLDRLSHEVESYFAGDLRSFETPIETPGTSFQRDVWTALREIPYGETRSYAEIAGRIGNPAAVRAVGRANGMNRLAVVIPCHRVVRSDGSLCGYGGGVWRKRRLLELEVSVPNSVMTGDGRVQADADLSIRS